MLSNNDAWLPILIRKRCITHVLFIHHSDFWFVPFSVVFHALCGSYRHCSDRCRSLRSRQVSQVKSSRTVGAWVSILFSIKPISFVPSTVLLLMSCAVDVAATAKACVGGCSGVPCPFTLALRSKDHPHRVVFSAYSSLSDQVKSSQILSAHWDRFHPLLRSCLCPAFLYLLTLSVLHPG